MESSIDKEKDITILNSCSKNEVISTAKTQRSYTPIFKPSPFLLQKRNSEKSLIETKNSQNVEKNLSEGDKTSDPKPSSSLQHLKYDSGTETPKFTGNRKKEKLMTFAAAADNMFKFGNVLDLQESPEQIQEEDSQLQINQTSTPNDNHPITLKQSKSQLEEPAILNDNSMALEKEVMQQSFKESLLKKGESSKTITSTSKSIPIPTATSIDLITKEMMKSTNVTSTRDDKATPNVEAKFTVNLLEFVRKKEPQKDYRPYVTTTSIENITEERTKPSEQFRQENKNSQSQAPITDISTTEKNPRKNLLTLAREEAANPKKTKEFNLNLELFGDSEGLSPIHSGNAQPLGLAFNLQGNPLSGRDSFVLDKTIYNVEEGIPIMDLDKYSFYENLKAVEFNEKSLNYSLERKDEDEPKKQLLNIHQTGGSRRNLLQAPHYFKSKTTHLDPLGTNETESSLVLSQKEKGSVESLASTTNVGSAGEFDTQGGNHLRPPGQLLNTSIFQGIKPSPSIFKKYQRTKSQVIETNHLDKTIDDEGQKKINQYVLVKELGRYQMKLFLIY